MPVWSDWRSWSRKLASALPTLLFVLFLWFALQRLRPETLDEDQAAPPLSVLLSNGQHFELSQARGTVTLINFWASYCPPCRKEAPELSKAHQLLQKSGGQVIGLSLDDMSLPQVASTAKQLGMHYPVALATRDQQLRYKVKSIPTTYLVDGEGIVRDAVVGSVSERRVRRMLERVNH